MICYRCGRIGHRAGTCTNTPQPQMVDELMARLGKTRCNDCGRYRHPESTCWNKPENAHLRPEGWQGPYHYAGYPKAAEAGNVSHDQTRLQECDLVQTSDEVSLAFADTNNSEIYTQIESKDTDEEPDLMDPEIWIGETRATTHSTAQHTIMPPAITGTRHHWMMFSE